MTLSEICSGGRETAPRKEFARGGFLAGPNPLGETFRDFIQKVGTAKVGSGNVARKTENLSYLSEIMALWVLSSCESIENGPSAISLDFRQAHFSCFSLKL